MGMRSNARQRRTPIALYDRKVRTFPSPLLWHRSGGNSDRQLDVSSSVVVHATFAGRAGLAAVGETFEERCRCYRSGPYAGYFKLAVYVVLAGEIRATRAEAYNGAGTRYLNLSVFHLRFANRRSNVVRCVRTGGRHVVVKYPSSK